jgi:hypothetical protein
MIANRALPTHQLLHPSLSDCFQLRISLKLADKIYKPQTSNNYTKTKIYA